MRIQKLGAALLLILLVTSGCAAQGAFSQEADGGALSISALFQAENGDKLEKGTAQFSAGETSASCPLDGSGAVSVSGLPRSGELLLTLFDRQQEVLGAMELSFGRGAVTDATTGEDGVGHITVRSGTDEVALIFVLSEDGALRCTLWLPADLQ